MLKFLNIALGGALGALLRYVVSGMAHRFFTSGFPWGTLIVNLVGSFIIGLVWGIFEVIAISQNIKVFILVGFLGAFTTFSTFSLENFHLLRDGEYGLVLTNTIASVVFGVALAFAGFFISRLLLGILK